MSRVLILSSPSSIVFISDAFIVYMSLCHTIWLRIPWWWDSVLNLPLSTLVPPFMLGHLFKACNNNNSQSLRFISFSSLVQTFVQAYTVGYCYEIRTPKGSRHSCQHCSSPSKFSPLKSYWNLGQLVLLQYSRWCISTQFFLLRLSCRICVTFVHMVPIV